MSDDDIIVPASVGVIGCGVIGAGWASRFRQCGVDVIVHDPSPSAADVFADVAEHTAIAWEALGIGARRPGTVEFVDELADACSGVGLVVESVPERLDVKHATLGAIDAATDPSTVISSSTSGFTPGELAGALVHPQRLVVGHPFNPVYLIPLVEVVGSTHTAQDVIDTATRMFRAVGMHPLVVRTEIPAHIADRLLEAVWREALWLVNDGVATTAEIDDAIRYGFGLRWAQMGLFESYRIAGGTGGMRHFIAQFGECLSWPWTKLTDTPELTDELVDRIADQSDEQSGGRSIRELERVRDRNLVAILSALENQGWGAGSVLAEFRARTGGRDPV